MTFLEIELVSIHQNFDRRCWLLLLGSKRKNRPLLLFLGPLLILPLPEKSGRAKSFAEKIAPLSFAGTQSSLEGREKKIITAIAHASCRRPSVFSDPPFFQGWHNALMPQNCMSLKYLYKV